MIMSSGRSGVAGAVEVVIAQSHQGKNGEQGRKNAPAAVPDPDPAATLFRETPMVQRFRVVCT
jgi:hypothetical protein